MSARCHCSDQGDPVVFGQCRKCRPEPEDVYADQLQSELDRLEPRWRTTLDDSGGDLG